MKHYQNQKTIAVIPARAGSKRLPNKNIRLLAGKPLVFYAINEARKSQFISEVYVSTENEEIATISENCGAKVVSRPMELANDEATTDSVLKHFIEYLNFDGNVVLLQPDNPLRIVDDIDGALNEFYRWEPSILASCGPSGEYNGAIWIFNTKDYKDANFLWRELTYINPFVYLMSARKSRANIHYQQDLEETEKLFKMSDDDYFRYNFKEHIKKEVQYPDKIGALKDYLEDKKSLEKLKKEDPVLYQKLRDNPERIAKILELPQSGQCLDIGCSDGIIAIELVKKNSCRKILGIDIRPEAIENANRLKLELPASLQEKIEFNMMKLEELAQAKKKFDTIFLTEVLEHLYFTMHRDFLRSLVSLMSLASNLIVSVPNRYPCKKYEGGGCSRWKFDGHLSHFSKLSLESLLSKFFKKIDFFPVNKEERVQDGVFLICNCRESIF